MDKEVMSAEVLETLAGAFLEMSKQEKNTPASGATGAASLYGSGGIFSTPGIEPDVITAHVRPHGLMAELPRFPSVMENPRFGAITGFTAAVGTEPDLPCDDAPAGYMKGCNLTAAFGRLQRDTQTIEFDKVMLQLHRGVSTDLRLRGHVLGLADLEPTGLSESDLLNVYTMAEMVTAGVNFERTMNVLSWQGSPANNNVGGGYKEFPGLDNQIATGQLDADSGVACAALDSDVKDFGANDVTGTTPNIVEYLSMLEYYLNYNARSMGLDPATWVIAMSPGMWYVLSEIWPCQYNTNRCATAIIGANSQTTLMGDQMTALRDQMRQGMFIEINGNRYKVVTDTGIADDGYGYGTYLSSIYMVPLTITGSFPVTYVEHVDYRAGARDVALLRNTEMFWTDNGQYSWAVEYEKWCYKLSVKGEFRIVLRTPQLAGRIDNILYEPLQQLRSPDPDSPYFADGGTSLRGGESLNAVWL